MLLVAAPGMDDPNFEGTVVFLFEVEDGAAGLILNRPSTLTVAQGMPGWEDQAADPPFVFFGGPVQSDRASALQVDPPAGTGLITDRVGMPDLTEALGDGGRVRIFAGHAGWSREQLADELEQRAWFLVGSAPEDIVDAFPHTQWRRILARQASPLRRYRNYPDDPTLN